MLVAPRPRSPPRLPDLCGRRRLQLELHALSREAELLREELQMLDGSVLLQKYCKEVVEFVGSKSDPLVRKSRKTNICFIAWQWIRSKLCFSCKCDIQPCSSCLPKLLDHLCCCSSIPCSKPNCPCCCGRPSCNFCCSCNCKLGEMIASCCNCGVCNSSCCSNLCCFEGCSCCNLQCCSCPTAQNLCVPKQCPCLRLPRCCSGETKCFQALVSFFKSCCCSCSGCTALCHSCPKGCFSCKGCTEGCFSCKGCTDGCCCSLHCPKLSCRCGCLC